MTANPIPPLRWSDMQRFYAKLVLGDCWEWQAAKARNGYGRFYVAGLTYPAHRVSLAIHGTAPEPDKDVDHLCRNRACVRPDHLQVVDRRTNIVRGEAASAASAGGVACPRGHDLTAPRAWGQSSSGRYCRLCSNERWVRWNRQRTT